MSSAVGGDGAMLGRLVAGPSVVRATGASAASSATRIAAMCSGVVPQQPPTIRAPASSRRAVTSPKYRGWRRRRSDPRAAGTARRSEGSTGPGLRRRRTERFERIETGRRAGTAIDADRIGPRGRERIRRDGRAAAICQRRLLAEGQRGDDRDVRGAASFLDRDEQLPEVRERLEEDQVSPALEQALDLLRYAALAVSSVTRAPRAGRTQRPDRAADAHIAATDVAGVAGELRRAPIDAADLLVETPRRQALPVRPE